MALAERTYSFRAPADLGERMRDASGLLTRLPDEARDWMAHEVAIAFVRHASEFGRERSQSAVMRHALELFVAAAEKIAEDLRYAAAYAADARAREATEPTIADAAMLAAADLWRDE